MRAQRVDYTSFFRASRRRPPAATSTRRSRTLFARAGTRSTPGSRGWRRTDARSWHADAMDAVNPVYIPRNHLVEEALDAATARRPRPVPPAARRASPTRSRGRPGLERLRRAGARPTSAATGRSAAPESSSKRWAAAAAASIMLPRTGHTSAPEEEHRSAGHRRRGSRRECRRAPTTCPQPRSPRLLHLRRRILPPCP